MKKLKGFTLAETLITLTVIGVVAAIVLPMIDRVRPNQELLMLRKAYYLSSRVVNELINDEELYPDTDDPNTSGFSNTVSVNYHGQNGIQGNNKFCILFAARMNLREQANCAVDANFTQNNAPAGNFTTTDGMVWGMPRNDFASGVIPGANGENIAQRISIDVNGNEAPNCFATDAGCRNPDRYIISVDRWGKLYVDDATRRMLTATDIRQTYDGLR